MKENAARRCNKVQKFPGAPNGAPKSSKTLYLGLFSPRSGDFVCVFLIIFIVPLAPQDRVAGVSTPSGLVENHIWAKSKEQKTHIWPNGDFQGR